MSIYEAAKQALDALEVWRDSLTDQSAISELRFCVVGEKAITALRTALAEDVPETNFGNMEQVVDSSQTDHIADASKMVATSQASRQVEPVAHITGYSKGRCIIEAVDPDWLLPVGMALYRSPSQREPLTDEEIQRCIYEVDDARLAGPITKFARAIERAHGIGGKE